MIATVLGTIAIVACTIAIGIVVDRKLGLLPRPDKRRAPAKRLPLTHDAGEAPAVAIRATPEQLATLCESQPCTRCGSMVVGAQDDGVQFNGHRLIVLGFDCPQCRARRSLYIDPV